MKLVAIPFFGLNFATLTGAVVIQGASARDRLGLDGFAVAQQAGVPVAAR